MTATKNRLNVLALENLLRMNRLYWSDNVECSNGWIRSADASSAPCTKGPGGPNKTWEEPIRDDKRAYLLDESNPKRSWRHLLCVAKTVRIYMCVWKMRRKPLCICIYCMEEFIPKHCESNIVTSHLPCNGVDDHTTRMVQLAMDDSFLISPVSCRHHHMFVYTVSPIEILW